MSKRSDIADEVIRRLKTITPAPVRFVDGTGGIWGNWGRSLPAVHYYEKPDERVIVKRGMYQITMPVQIEFIIRVNNKSLMYDEGRLKLEQIISAIEIDERLRSAVTEKDTVIDYYSVSTEIIDIMDDVLGVGIIYEFVYADKHKGYEVRRPHIPSNV